MPKLLLHICCASCASVVLERLANKFSIVGFFYNPNIHPEEEYKKRLKEVEKIAKLFGFYFFSLKKDETKRWFRAVKGLENEPERGKRCEICFQIRLDKTAQLAKQNNFDYFTTTLTVSPYKEAEKINKIGRMLSDRYKVKFLEADFKKKGGATRSCQLSKELGIFRQNYCGCIFSRMNLLNRS